MPQAVVAAAVTTGVQYAGGQILANAIVGTFIRSLATSVILGALAKATSKNPADAILGQTATVRDAIGPHQIIYGRTRVGGNMIYMAVTDKVTQTSFYDDWTGQATQSTNTISNAYLHLVIALAGHEIDAVEAVYTATDSGVEELSLDGNGFSLRSSKYGNKIRVQYQYGTDSQTAFSDLVSETANIGDSKWTTSHRVRGSALAYIRLEYDADKFPNGIPSFSFKIRGKKVYDPRTSSTAWSANSALCLADYLTNTRYGLGCDYSTEIDAAALIAAANVCDEDVALDAGGAENRYECHGVLSTSSRPGDSIAKILSSMAGKAVWSSGKWRIIPGVYYTPELTFGENDLRGPLSIQTLISRRDSFNGVKGIFSAAAQDYKPASFPQIVSSVAVTADGESVFRDIELPLTTSTSMAQRLAKIELLKIRQQITVSMPMKLQGLKANVGDIIQVNNTRMGWSAKKFEVVGMSIGTGLVPGVDLSLREISTDVFNWSTSEEQTIDPARNTNLPKIRTVANVRNIKFNIGEYYDSSGGVMTWECDDSFVSSYEVSIDGTAAANLNGLRISSTISADLYWVGVQSIGLESYDRFKYVITDDGSNLAKYPIGGTLSTNTSTGSYVVKGGRLIVSLIAFAKDKTITEAYFDGTNIILYAVRKKGVQAENVTANTLVLTLTSVTVNVVIENIAKSPSKTIKYFSIVQSKEFGGVQFLPGPYLISIKPINILGVRGTPSLSYVYVPPPPLPSRVSGLELDLGKDGQSNATEWTGRDVKLKWRHASFSRGYEINDLEFGGAESGDVDAYLKDYRVVVYNASGVLLREEFVTTNAYVYTYEKNAEDAAKQGDLPYRELSFKVWARGKQNQISEQAATL